MAQALSTGDVVFSSIGGQQILEIPREAATKLMRKYTLTYGTFYDDALNVYDSKSVGVNKVLTFGNFTPPSHLFQPRLNGCTWNPKGKIGHESTKLTMSDVEVNMEQCPDALWGCWETIFGPGMDIHNLPPEIVNELMYQIYIGLGNSYKMMNEWGDHAVIDLADENGWGAAAIGASAWNDFKGQQMSTTGFMTLVDQLKDAGDHPHFAVDISSYYDSEGNFTGDVFDFLDAVIKARTLEFKVAENQPGAMIKGIIRLDGTTFEALGTQFTQLYQNVPDQYTLFLNGVNGQVKLNNSFKYKGYAVIPETSWDVFDSLTGTKTRRAVLSYPKVFGQLYDMPGIAQYNGLGLRMEKSPIMRDKGRIDMMTNMRVGNVIFDHKFVVNASQLFTPSIG